MDEGGKVVGCLLPPTLGPPAFPACAGTAASLIKQGMAGGTPDRGWNGLSVVRGTSKLGTLNELRLALQLLMNSSP